MNKAKELLSKKDSVSNVDFAVGYNDPLYFSRIFKKQQAFLFPISERS